MKIKAIIYLLLISTFFYGCSNCEETTGRTETLDLDFQKLLFPYESKKNVTYLRNKKDTIIFCNYGLQTNYNYTYTEVDCSTKIPLEQNICNLLIVYLVIISISIIISVLLFMTILQFQ